MQLDTPITVTPRQLAEAIRMQPQPNPDLHKPEVYAREVLALAVTLKK